MSMTSRERVHTTLRHIEPDRVPYNMWLVDEIAEQFGGMERFAERFRHDIREVELCLPDKPEGVPVTEWTPSPRQEDVARAAEAVVALQARGIAVQGSYFMGVYEQAKDWLETTGKIPGERLFIVAPRIGGVAAPAGGGPEASEPEEVSLPAGGASPASPG